MKISLRKFLSLILSVLFFLSFNTIYAFATEDSIIRETLTCTKDEETPDEIRPEDEAPAENTYRYYFYLPKEWENEYTQTAGIYWWEGTGAQKRYPGIEARKASVEGLFFYDVPKDVTMFYLSNFLDGGTDITQEVYHLAYQTNGLQCEGYEEGENKTYPEGLENFNNMVYVVDFDKGCWKNCLDYHGKHIPGGEWYFYYGNGEYGITPEKGENVFTQRSFGSFEDEDDTPPTTPTKPDKAPYYTVYFENTAHWENVYIAWYSTEINENAGWPGEAMTYVKTDLQGHDIYSFEVTHFAELIIFTNGEEQTRDITVNIEDGKMFFLDRKQGGLWLTGTAEYVEKNYELGDADRNGKVDVRDATLIQKFVANLKAFDQNVFIISDFDHDETITVKDATCIQKTIAGLI